MEVSEAKKIKELEQENLRLKKHTLNIDQVD
jgi:hypothetical protein